MTSNANVSNMANDGQNHTQNFMQPNLNNINPFFDAKL